MKTYSEFHDGLFEGLRIEKDQKVVHVYLRTSGGQRTTVCLRGVVMLKAGGFREGNIIFESSVRNSGEITLADIAELYELDPNNERARWEHKLLERVREEQLQILEVNPSYGGSCVILAKTIELMPRSDAHD